MKKIFLTLAISMMALPAFASNYCYKAGTKSIVGIAQKSDKRPFSIYIQGSGYYPITSGVREARNGIYTAERKAGKGLSAYRISVDFNKKLLLVDGQKQVKLVYCQFNGNE